MELNALSDELAEAAYEAYAEQIARSDGLAATAIASWRELSGTARSAWRGAVLRVADEIERRAAG